MIKQILKKSCLVIIGLFFALLFLETAMWTGGFALSNWQKYKNNRALKNKAQYTVMCIGESTTHNQYPGNLQKILNTKYPEKFSIIDCGRSGTNLTAILESLDANIKKYRPDIAVCMMGGVDPVKLYGNLKNPSGSNIFDKIKIYKLFRFTQEDFESSTQIKQINKYTDILADSEEEIIYDNNDQLLHKAEHLFRMGDYDKSIKILTDIVKRDPKNERAYVDIIHIYFYHLPKFKDTAYKMALKMLADGAQYDRAELYLKVIFYNLEKDNIPLAKQFINQLLNEQNLKISINLYGVIKDFLTDEQKEKILISQQTSIFLEKTDNFYGAIAIHYIEQQNYEKADIYFNKAEQLRITFPNEEKSTLYRLIIQKLIDNNTKVICMQYPVRSLKPLKNILKDTRYYDKVTFLSNEEIFKQALKEKPYDEIFVDQFGGDFGHCTDYGNTLIAENVAENLLKLIQ